MSPHEIHIGHNQVFVQWDERGPFVVLGPDGIEGEQLAIPSAEQIWPVFEDWEVEEACGGNCREAEALRTNIHDAAKALREQADDMEAGT